MKDVLEKIAALLETLVLGVREKQMFVAICVFETGGGRINQHCGKVIEQ